VGAAIRFGHEVSVGKMFVGNGSSFPQRSGFATCQFQTETEQEFVSAAEALMASHHYVAAHARYTSALKLNPNNARYHLGIAYCNWHLDNDVQTGQHLHEAIRLDPNLAQAHATLAMWYLIHGMSDAANRSSDIAYELEPGNLEVLTSRGNMLEQAGDSQAVCELLQRAGRVADPTPAFALLNGKMARRRGNVPEALSTVFAVLNTGRGSVLDVSALHLMAAGLLDGMGDYDRAFDQAQRGNAIRRPPWNPHDSKRDVDKTISFLTKEKCSTLPRSAETTRLPVFVVGFLRSGTSLVEQILASHPRIFGGGEMDLLHWTEDGTRKMLQASSWQYPACLDRLTPDQADGLAQSHLGPLKALSPESDRIIDKMPFNGLHLAIVQMLLPGSRVIYCRRDPLDTCLSTYMTQFSHGNAFKYDQTHLGLFYRQYERLMEHWKTVLDIPILDVSYEKLVNDIEGESRRMLEFLDIPWDDRCAKFYETRRPVATASSEQVRLPPYRSSIGRWKHYEKHIQPLKAALGIPA
jgi:tetratricopeptide (TPR) repeat protein